MRLRMKVWTDPQTGKRYLMPQALMKSKWSSVVTVYAMSDEETKMVELTPRQWNELPFHYFKEDGQCPPEERPVREADEVHL